MSLQSWSEVLMSSQADGPTISTATTASIIPTHALLTIPANFWSIGKRMRVTIRGRMSNVVTTPGNITFLIKFGATTVWTSQAQAMNTTAKTNVTFQLVVDLVCRAVGSGTSTTLLGVGQFTSESIVGAAAGQPLDVFMPATAPAVGTGFDCTVSQLMDTQVTFSVASNAITTHMYTVEALN